MQAESSMSPMYSKTCRRVAKIHTSGHTLTVTNMGELVQPCDMLVVIVLHTEIRHLAGGQMSGRHSLQAVIRLPSKAVG